MAISYIDISDWDYTSETYRCKYCTLKRIDAMQKRAERRLYRLQLLQSSGTHKRNFKWTIMQWKL